LRRVWRLFVCCVFLGLGGRRPHPYHCIAWLWWSIPAHPLLTFFLSSRTTQKKTNAIVIQTSSSSSSTHIHTSIHYNHTYTWFINPNKGVWSAVLDYSTKRAPSLVLGGRVVDLEGFFSNTKTRRNIRDGPSCRNIDVVLPVLQTTRTDERFLTDCLVLRKRRFSKGALVTLLGDPLNTESLEEDGAPHVGLDWLPAC